MRIHGLLAMLCGVRRFFYFPYTIESVFLRYYGWHLDLSMPWASRAGRSVSSLSKSQKQASTLPLCPQFSPAHRRTTCAGLLFISFMAFLVHFFYKEHYCRLHIFLLSDGSAYILICLCIKLNRYQIPFIDFLFCPGIRLCLFLCLKGFNLF